MSVKFAETVVLMMLALVSDIISYKIKNSITCPFIVIGLMTNLISDGIKGLTLSLAATVLPVLVLIALYMLRMLGAGDIKLFSAIGAIMGVSFILYAMVYSFLSGGVIAMAVMIFRKNGRQRLTHLLKYIKICLTTFSLQPYTDFADKSDGAKFRFSYAVFCGTLICLIIL